MEIGQRVRAKRKITDNGKLTANVGDEGVVENIDPSFPPTIRFYDTGRVFDCTHEDVEVLP
jgi:hypothetical protein